MLWKQYPRWPSSFGPCSRKCDSDMGGRGGGPCAICIEKDLAALVGAEEAYAYHMRVKDIRTLERSFEEKVAPEH